MMNAANSEGENDLPNDDDEEEKKLLAIHFFDIAHVQPHFA